MNAVNASGLSITDLLTLTLMRIIAVGVDNLPTKFGLSRTFHSRLISQHLSDTSRDIVTFPFDLRRSQHLSLMWVFVLRLCTKFEVCRQGWQVFAT